MCILIDPLCVILNILQVQDRADRPQLKTFALEFKKRVPSAYIDISDASVYNAIEGHREILSLTDNAIGRTDAFGSFAEREFLDRTINRRFPENIRITRPCSWIHRDA